MHDNFPKINNSFDSLLKNGDGPDVISSDVHKISAIRQLLLLSLLLLMPLLLLYVLVAVLSSILMVKHRLSLVQCYQC